MGTIWQILSPPIRKVFSFLNKRSNKMDRHLFAVIIALLVSGMLFGCGGEPQQEESDERFSGPEFSEHVRTTDPRTPEEERLGFKLPPGFEIELYASEDRKSTRLNSSH